MANSKSLCAFWVCSDRSDRRERRERSTQSVLKRKGLAWGDTISKLIVEAPPFRIIIPKQNFAGTLGLWIPLFRTKVRCRRSYCYEAIYCYRATLHALKQKDVTRWRPGLGSTTFAMQLLTATERLYTPSNGKKLRDGVPG